jgi:hypothetical protein
MQVMSSRATCDTGLDPVSIHTHTHTHTHTLQIKMTKIQKRKEEKREEVAFIFKSLE